MKKTILLFAFCALCAAVFARPVTRTEAKRAAIAVLGDIELADETGVDDGKLKPFYVFSRGKGRGYVIASGDDRVTPVLGLTKQGDFCYDELPEPLQQMLGFWNKRIGEIQLMEDMATADNLSVEQRAKRKVRKAQVKDVAPLIETHWHQSSPYNDLCPVMENGSRTLTGCVATAGAQVIYYFSKDNPTETLYDTPTYGYGTPVTESIPKGTPIEYGKMLKSGKGTAAQNHAVALLMYVTGTSTWLTYGSSTSGQVSDLGNTLNGQFNISNSCLYKSGYGQASWEKIILDNLNTRRPLVYSGVHPDNGGHAVVLDGYRAAGNLFHFNFGWGGQGDGYYTVDDETGMNGFCGQQSMLSMPTPKNPKVNVTMSVGKMYQQTDCPIEITIENKATLDYSGIYLYCTTGSTMPSTASFSDTETVIESGTTGTITATYKPTSSKPLNIWLCDKNKNVLDKQTVEIEQTAAYLHLNSIDIDASAETEMLDGMAFRKVNNTTVNVTMNLTNGEGGTFCQPTIRCTVEKLNPETGVWGTGYQKILQDITFEAGETKDVVFTIDNVKTGNYYRAFLYKKVRTAVITDAVYDTPDSIVYFMTENPDLAMAVDGRHAKVTGKWNSGIFAQLPLTEDITSYDFTEVTGLNEKPEAPNPNAVFFTTADVEGSNIIKDNVCEDLFLCTDFAFATPSVFTANKAKLTLTGATPGEFKDVFVPFAAKAPEGMLVRRVNGVTSTAITVDNLREIPAYTSIIYMADRNGVTAIEAENVQMQIETFYETELLAGCTVPTETDGTLYLFGQSSTGVPSFLKTTAGTVMPAFSTAIRGTSKSAHRALPSLTVDRAYMDLSKTLAEAWLLVESAKEDKTQSALDKLLAAIAEAETVFVAGDAETKDVVTTAENALKAAMKAYEEELLTGIEGVLDSEYRVQNSRSGVQSLYNLAGQKVAADYKGIIIKNGKKILNK